MLELGLCHAFVQGHARGAARSDRNLRKLMFCCFAGQVPVACPDKSAHGPCPALPTHAPVVMSTSSTEPLPSLSSPSTQYPPMLAANTLTYHKYGKRSADDRDRADLGRCRIYGDDQVLG